MDSFSFVALLVAWGSAWQDFKTFKVPNLFTVSAALFGLILHTYSTGWDGLWTSLAGLGLGLALLLPLYALSGMAAGDVKLMGALGALLGTHAILSIALLSLFVAAALGLAYSLRAWRTRSASGPWKRYGQMLRFLLTTGRPSYQPPDSSEALAEPLPLAVPIAIGVTGVLLFGL